MKKLISLAAVSEILAEYGGPGGLGAACGALDCDGCELIWGGEELPDDLSPGLTYGYHLTFFPDWLDFWRGDRKALTEKYGNEEAWARFYGGRDGRETLLALYRADLERAARLGAPYVVFHVSDVSLEEGYTYRWRHTHREVIDASLEVLSLLLPGRDWPFALLVENQWWPGFTFTDPEQTAYLLDGIPYENKGIMLDVGHLMNTNTGLRTQAEGADYVHAMLERHGALRTAVRGLHLHQSLSGDFVRANTGSIPPDFPPPEECEAQFAASYAHILQIDRHQPWTDPVVGLLVEYAAPDYLVHELSAPGRTARDRAVRAQMKALYG